MPKHVHAELIKAWADGAEVEFRYQSGLWKATAAPSWDPFLEYRIKPAPKSLGQIAYDAFPGNYHNWNVLFPDHQNRWEITAQAVKQAIINQKD